MKHWFEVVFRLWALAGASVLIQVCTRFVGASGCLLNLFQFIHDWWLHDVFVQSCKQFMGASGHLFPSCTQFGTSVEFGHKQALEVLIPSCIHIVYNLESIHRAPTIARIVKCTTDLKWMKTVSSLQYSKHFVVVFLSRYFYEEIKSNSCWLSEIMGDKQIRQVNVRK